MLISSIILCIARMRCTVWRLPVCTAVPMKALQHVRATQFFSTSQPSRMMTVVMEVVEPLLPGRDPHDDDAVPAVNVRVSSFT
jgi:hypothetical protein